MRGSTRRTATVLSAAALLAACSDSGSPSTDAQVNFSVATRSASAAVAAAASLATTSTPEQFADGAGNTLVIDQVQLVLREIELKRLETTTTCGEAVSGDACEKLEVGPVLLDLPLGVGGAARSFSVPIDTGTFNEIEFDIHRPEGSDDAAFIQAHPDFNGVSVRVTGTYNGAAFTYTTDLDSEEEIALDPPLAVAAAGATDVTLFIDLNGWFRDGSGNLVSPESANSGSPNEGLVENNIKSTLRAFEDENHDGTDDHGGSVG